jgi:Protein of unknown function (DUF1592)/Protein of unknown function (DUF1588)/Protein of unknown function (DUF1595)/Protein of unknown function (DUF1587)/Protein of unknown function (DUF1585)
MTSIKTTGRHAAGRDVATVASERPPGALSRLGADRWLGVALTLGALSALLPGCGTEPGASAQSPGSAAGATASGGSPAGVGGSGSSAAGVNGLGGDPYAVPSTAPAAVLVPTPRLARLSRQQWSNTIRDLLKLADVADVENGVSGDALINFDNEAEALFVTEQLRQQLATAAEKLADKVTADATAFAALVPAEPAADSAGRARAFITTFGRRAFRRPLTDAEITTHLGLFNQAATLYPGADAFKAGIGLVIQAVLQSPYFLYRTELGVAAGGAAKVPLNDHEIAAKLAYSLTNTMPDAELSAAADAGMLRDAAGVAAQAKRLLEGERGTNGFNNFNLQVYRLGTYDGIVRDPVLFPDFTPAAPASMRREVLAFIDWMFAEGRGVKDFYTTPVGFVNTALAPLYGVTGNFSADTLTKVELDPTQRSGILTQPGFLSSYSKGADPDIIHRGVFIATRLLCKELPPPAPNAGALLDLQPDMTNRERVEATTGKGTCGEVCHANLMNPLGYAFENYDAIGKFRTMDHGQPVDAADVYRLDGELKTFKDGVELSHALAEAKELHACYVQNMMTYLNGRAVKPDESITVDYYARLSRAGMTSLRDLQLAIVTSDAFLNRLP